MTLHPDFRVPACPAPSSPDSPHACEPAPDAPAIFREKVAQDAAIRARFAALSASARDVSPPDTPTS